MLSSLPPHYILSPPQIVLFTIDNCPVFIFSFYFSPCCKTTKLFSIACFFTVCTDGYFSHFRRLRDSSVSHWRGNMPSTCLCQLSHKGEEPCDGFRSRWSWSLRSVTKSDAPSRDRRTIAGLERWDSSVGTVLAVKALESICSGRTSVNRWAWQCMPVVPELRR